MIGAAQIGTVGGLILGAVLTGGVYGFALYVRDVTRAVRRARNGQGFRLWERGPEYIELAEKLRSLDEPIKPTEPAPLKLVVHINEDPVTHRVITTYDDGTTSEWHDKDAQAWLEDQPESPE